jgi:hypothetical protein
MCCGDQLRSYDRDVIPTNSIPANYVVHFGHISLGLYGCVGGMMSGNPNESAPPFVDGFPLPAAPLNRLAANIVGAFPVVTKTENYAILATDNQTTFDNGGASGPVVLSLPPAAPGLRYSFVVASPQMLVVLAADGDVISIGTGESSTGGNAQSDVPFSFLSLIVPNGASGQWVASGSFGAWVLT